MKKVLTTILAGALVLSMASVSVFADSTDGLVAIPSGAAVVNGDGDTVTTSNETSLATGKVVLDGITPGRTIYIPLGDDTDTTNVTQLIDSDDNAAGTAYPVDLGDSDLFKISTDKDGTGKSLISSVSQVANKKLGDGDRGSYLKVVIADSTTTSDLKANVTVTFKAKKDVDAGDGNSASGTWEAGDNATLDMVFWINNKAVSGSDGDAETGERVYFDPESNEDNVMIWGDDRAALVFSATDNASDFYCRLSTASDNDIYTTYADPIDADLWFYNFVGNPTIPTTSRATLTLGVPWDDDEGPAPEDCYIYLLDDDGYLTDVTDSFTYSEDDEEIAGWSTKTRTLGTYILSDSELDIEVIEDVEDDTSSDDSTVVDDSDKVIPNTGSSDMVGLAVTAGIISLAAAATLAFKKAGK